MTKSTVRRLLLPLRSIAQRYPVGPVTWRDVKVNLVVTAVAITLAVIANLVDPSNHLFFMLVLGGMGGATVASAWWIYAIRRSEWRVQLRCAPTLTFDTDGRVRVEIEDVHIALNANGHELGKFDMTPMQAQHASDDFYGINADIPQA